jgi:LPS export ABC transporter protein LptC
MTHRKKTRIKFIILCCIGIFIIGLSTVVYINIKLKKLIKHPKTLIKLAKNIPDLSLENVHYEKTTKGKIEWEINAKLAHHFQGKDKLTLDVVKMVYYDKKSRTIVITGSQGRIKPSTKDVALLGKVLIKSSDGYTLKTNCLKYNAKTSLITTDDHVSISGKKFQVKGVGMVLSIKKNKMSILHAVHTTINGNFIKGDIPSLGF